MNEKNDDPRVTSPEELKLFWIIVVLAIICIILTADYTKIIKFIADTVVSTVK